MVLLGSQASIAGKGPEKGGIIGSPSAQVKLGAVGVD